MEKIKIRISSFVSVILDNDAQTFGFVKSDGTSNKNALLNKLIPTLVECRKYRRDQIHDILSVEYNRNDCENIYDCVNTVIDRVYFRDEELDVLDEELWIRPNKSNAVCFDEIENSEIRITAQELTTYIRGLLNEYVRLPQYKREVLVFNKEIYDFDLACSTGRIFHYKIDGISHRAYAYKYVYGYLHDQINYLILYEIDTKVCRAIALHAIRDSYVVKHVYNAPNINKIENVLDKFEESFDFNSLIGLEEAEFELDF